jgi:cytochrome c peroxidase
VRVAIRVGNSGRRHMATSLPGASLSAGAGLVGLAGVYLGYRMFFAGGYKREGELREAIVNILENYDYDDGSLAPVLLRLAWHTSGTWCEKTKTGGSTGATMRFAPESIDDANAGLEKARAFLEPIKEKFPEVSYADLWVFAGIVGLEEMGGPHVQMRWGRKDLDEKSDKIPPNGRLPDASQGPKHIRDIFYRMGFNDQEIVALVGGGHAVGRCHTDRSGYDGPWNFSPTTFSNEYFRVLFEDKWKEKRWRGPKQFEDSTKKLMMLPTDMAMIEDPDFRKWSEIYYKDSDRLFKDFAKAFKKLVENGFNDKSPCRALN